MYWTIWQAGSPHCASLEGRGGSGGPMGVRRPPLALGGVRARAVAVVSKYHNCCELAIGPCMHYRDAMAAIASTLTCLCSRDQRTVFLAFRTPLAPPWPEARRSTRRTSVGYRHRALVHRAAAINVRQQTSAAQASSVRPLSQSSRRTPPGLLATPIGAGRGRVWQGARRTLRTAPA